MVSVLHDMDLSSWDTLAAIKRGIKLIIYAISRIFRVRFSFVEDIYLEARKNADIIIKLDKLVGVESIIGINTDVLRDHPNIMKELREFCPDVREHIHIGDKNYRPLGWRKFSDPNRKRLWIPPLDQPKETWHYDLDYEKGTLPLLKEGQLPIFHIDSMNSLSNYINFLYWLLIENGKIYE